MTGIERLNACFHEFPEPTKDLLHHMVPCPAGMERHVMHRVLPDGSKAVTTIGLLNGTLFRSGQRLAYSVPEPEYKSRYDELAAVQDYALIPARRFHECEPDGSGSRLSASVAPATSGLSFEEALPFIKERKRVARAGWRGEFCAELCQGEVVLRDVVHDLPAVWTGIWADILAMDWEVVA